MKLTSAVIRVGSDARVTMKPGVEFMSYADDWGNVFNKSIQSFTGRNKVGGPQERNVLEDVVKESGDFVKSLKTLDANNPAGQNPKEVADYYKKFAKEYDGNFKTQKTAYIKYLDAAIRLVDKQQWPLPYRELKVIKTKVEHLDASIGTQYQLYGKEYQKEKDKLDAQITKKRDEVRKGGGSDEDVKNETYILSMKKVLKGWGPLAKSSLTKAATGIQTIKADPRPEIYNNVMNAAGRDVSQTFKNIIKLKGDQKAQGWQLVRDLPNIAGFDAELTAFGNGNKRTVDNDASSQDVLARLKEFSAMVKGLVQIYPQIDAAIKRNP